MSSTRHRLVPQFFSLLLAGLQGMPVHAAPPAVGDRSAFEAGFVEGQAQLDRGEPLAAARTWLAAARNLPESAANRDNRVAIFEHIADAFQQALGGSTDREALREATAALQEYCDGFTRAYGTETPLSAKIAGARDDFKARLRVAEAAAGPAGPPPAPGLSPAPAPTPVPSPRSGRSLVLGGGVMLALGVGGGAMAAVYGARGQSLERQFDDRANDCHLSNPIGMCKGLLADGKASNAIAVGGLVAGTLLVGGGVALLVTGLRRRLGQPPSIAPMLAPGYAGLGLHRRF